MKLALKILNIIVSVALVLLIAAGATMAISARRSQDRIPSLLGHKVLTVLSGSMEPSIHTGDLIFVKPLGPGDLVREKDVITYWAKVGSDMLITHRVVGIISVNGKPVAYTTKGDANDAEDMSTVAQDLVLGIYRSRLPYFGYILSFIRKPIGVILCVIVPGVVLIGIEFRKMWKLLADQEAAKKANGDKESKAS